MNVFKDQCDLDNDKERESSRRWEDRRRVQLGTCIALFLSYSIALFGFILNIFIEKHDIVSSSWGKYILLLSLFFVMLSAFCGLFAYITRLEDFKATAKVVRSKAKANLNPGMLVTVNQWRIHCRWLGQWTWGLFYGQLITFLLAVISFLGAILITYYA